jgi:glutamate formiminotransferase
MEMCVCLAREFGKRYHQETGIPVYYYEEAALRSDRTNLEVIRKGQFEGLKTEISRSDRHPDVGAPRLHPTAGATVIGARKFVIALNVNLGTEDVNVAREIAKAVRKSSGGLGHVKAIGLAIEARGLVQVSLNIVDYQRNPLYRVLELIRMEAGRWGVPLVETEVCGMVPAAAIVDSLAYYMQLAGFNPDQVLELRLFQSLSEHDA